MEVYRFGDTKINLDTLTRPEVLALNRYAHEHLTQALGEVATLNRFMSEQGYFKPAPTTEPQTHFEHDPFGDGL